LQGKQQTKAQDNMNKHIQAVSDDVGRLALDARALMDATADVAEQKVIEARKPLATAVDGGKKLFGRVRDKAVERVRAADQTVHENPYHIFGIAFAVGALIGFLLRRRNGDYIPQRNALRTTYLKSL
jgi:ElaB/YqjD/DUF883 family membrane-anchored ribosome-binding protein